MRDRQKIAGRQRQAAALAALCALLGACATQPTSTESVAQPAPPPVEDIDVRPPVVTPDPKDATVVDTAPPADPISVAVVLSSRSPAFDDVATALADYFDETAVYDFSDKSLPPVRAFRLINDSPADVVVAIGLRAARASNALSAVPVVFSQVFNYQEHALLGENSRGVAAVAPLDAQLAAWKEAEPTLTTIGLIIGPGHDALLQEAELAAERHNVSLTTSIASSDQAALYEFKRMVRNIDGFWLLPDNRILSGRVLTEMMDRAQRRGVSVLVPTPGMLPLGASISVSTVASDIAARIHDIAQAIADGRIDDVEPLTPLTEIQVEVRSAPKRPADVANVSQSGAR